MVSYLWLVYLLWAKPEGGNEPHMMFVIGIIIVMAIAYGLIRIDERWNDGYG